MTNPVSRPADPATKTPEEIKANPALPDPEHELNPGVYRVPEAVSTDVHGAVVEKTVTKTETETTPVAPTGKAITSNFGAPEEKR